MPATELTDLQAAIRRSVVVLSSSGVETARADAELLAAHVLGTPRTRLAVADGLTPEQAARLAELVARRAARVPLQHLTGRAPFRHTELAVGPGVFVPRPETELLVSWGLSTLGGLAAPVVVDLCSGSGAIAVAVARECPHATVYAVERDPAALEWLRRNTAGLPVTIVDGDATDGSTLSTLDGRVDLVLCNPPYVPAGAAVPPEVRRYDPAVAVFAGADGLDVIRPLVGRVAALLRPGTGRFGVEHDDTQAQAVPELLERDGRFGDIDDHLDLGGRPRFATARRLADFTP
jgi:release factor glutamine methyltransferase